MDDEYKRAVRILDPTILQAKKQVLAVGEYVELHCRPLKPLGDFGIIAKCDNLGAWETLRQEV